MKKFKDYIESTGEIAPLNNDKKFTLSSLFKVMVYKKIL